MAKAKRKYLRWVIIALGLVCLLFIIGVFVLTMPSPTLDKRIAEFEAKRKIPDSENAAVIYNKLFENYDKNQFESLYINDPNFREKAWSAKDYPKAAEWLKTQKYTISELIKASEFKKCYFPTPFETNSFSKHVGNFITFSNWVRLMIFAAKNDIGERRFNAAIEKYRCSLRMSEHIRQQSTAVDFLRGIAFENLSLSYISKLIMDANINEHQLKKIEEFPVDAKDEWKSIWPQIQEAQKLYDEKQMENLTFLQRVQMKLNLIKINYRMTGQIFDTTEKTEYTFYLKNLTYRKGNSILIGLRLFKNKKGKWPESLEQIKSLVDPNAFVDPQNNSSFVYKLTDDSFTLYSRGPNNIDEGGSRNEPADDWMIWPGGR